MGGGARGGDEDVAEADGGGEGHGLVDALGGIGWFAEVDGGGGVGGHAGSWVGSNVGAGSAMGDLVRRSGGGAAGTTVHVDGAAVDVAGGVRGEEDCDAGDFFRVGDAAGGEL